MGAFCLNPAFRLAVSPGAEVVEKLAKLKQARFVHDDLNDGAVVAVGRLKIDEILPVVRLRQWPRVKQVPPAFTGAGS